MRSAQASNSSPWLIYISAWVIVGVIILISIQPSLAISKSIVGWIDTSIVEWLFGWIPLIGNIVLFLLTGIGYLLAIADFVITQYFELDWFFGEVTPASKRLRFFAYAKELIQTGLISPPYKGGWTAFFNDAPIWDTAMFDWKNIAIFGLMCFAVEAVVKILQPHLRLRSNG